MHKEDVVYTLEYYSVIKKWISPISSNIDRPRDYHTKWSEADWENKYHMISLICGI